MNQTVLDDWQEKNDKNNKRRRRKRKTDNSCGPSGKRRNTPFIDRGVQKCTDCRRIVGGVGGLGEQVCCRPPPGTTTPPLGPQREGGTVMGQWGCRRDGGEGEQCRA